jgi:hypothetical protein
MKNIHKISTGIAIAGLLVIASAAYAQTASTNKGFFGHGGHAAFVRPIAGTVSAINGTTSLTMTVQASSTAAITTYTVNTSGSKILKSGATTTVSSIQVNDKISVIGTVAGTNITAKVIIDGVLPQTTGPPAWTKGGRTGSTIGRSFASSTRAFNKTFVRPSAIGSVSSIIDSSSFTLAERTKTSTTTLTIDTNSSTVFREGLPAGQAGTTTAAFSNLAVGNLVAVTGTTTSTDQILASKVTIIPKTSFGKGMNSKGSSGHRKGSFKGFASTTPQ